MIKESILEKIELCPSITCQRGKTLVEGESAIADCQLCSGRGFRFIKNKPGISFTIPKPPMSLNTMLRMHYITRMREQQSWDLFVLARWTEFGKLTFNVPVNVIYVISFGTKRNRDLDNYIGGTKFVTDALKRTFIPEDNTEWLKKIQVEFLTGKPETKIIIEEA